MKDCHSMYPDWVAGVELQGFHCLTLRGLTPFLE
jgi:hypothetical protein